MPAHRRNSNDSLASSCGSLEDKGSCCVIAWPSFDPVSGPWPCGLAHMNGCVLGLGLISVDDLKTGSVVRITCSSESCPRSPFCHSACFEAYEGHLREQLQSYGQDLSWSDFHGIANMRSMRVFEKVLKACECPCDKGYLRKDLVWPTVPMPPPPPPLEPHSLDLVEDGEPARKCGGSGGDSTGLSLTMTGPSVSPDGNRSLAFGLPNLAASDECNGVLRDRSHSLTSNSSKESLASSPTSSTEAIHQPDKKSLIKERTRHDSMSSIFSRRPNYASFNLLPRHKINSYHIKMEDECSIGNDETRIFILSSFASNKMSKVPCVFCQSQLTIFDRYPLLDGTLFLSPTQHTLSCIKVKFEGKGSFLTAICMSCLEGWTGGGILCRFCVKPWSGAQLVLGTMYSYDIFAAMPCCTNRLKCNNCMKLIMRPDQRFNYFSDYSKLMTCPHCGSQEPHFAKNILTYVRADDAAATTKKSLPQPSPDQKLEEPGKQTVH